MPHLDKSADTDALYIELYLAEVDERRDLDEDALSELDDASLNQGRAVARIHPLDSGFRRNDRRGFENRQALLGNGVGGRPDSSPLC